MAYTDEWKQQRVDAAAAWLKEVRRLALRSKRTLDELESYMDATGVKGTDYSAVRVSSSPTPDGIHALAMRHMELMERHEGAALDYMAASDVARAAIDALEDERHQLVLSAHYLQGRTWESVAETMHYSDRHIFTLRMDALDAIYDLMPAERRIKVEPAL